MTEGTVIMTNEHGEALRDDNSGQQITARLEFPYPATSLPAALLGLKLLALHVSPQKKTAPAVGTVTVSANFILGLKNASNRS